jgi:hypothetical protein
MTDRAQFEAMLEALINEDQATAKELFHNIVVAKSREIYEELLAEDFDEEPVDEMFGDEGEEDGEGEEDEEGEDDGEESPFGDEDEEDGEESPFGDEGEEDGDVEDRVLDLEDALEELKAEFEQLMAGEEEESEHTDMFNGEEEPADDMGMGAEPAMGAMGGMGEMFREYTEKVPTAKMGDNGANTRSVMAKPNRMGGTASNIAQGGESGAGGTKGGLLNPSTKEENFGNVNVPGGNAGKTAFKKKEPGHGAERKGTGDNGDKGAASTTTGLKSRAK